MYDQKLLNDAVRKLAWKRIQENTIVDGDILIDKRIAEVSVPEVDSTRKFYVL